MLGMDYITSPDQKKQKLTNNLSGIAPSFDNFFSICFFALKISDNNSETALRLVVSKRKDSSWSCQIGSWGDLLLEGASERHGSTSVDTHKGTACCFHIDRQRRLWRG